MWDESKSINSGKLSTTQNTATKDGWMQTTLIEKYFKECFLPAVGPIRPILLIYVDHATNHINSVIVEEARKENMTLINLTPQSSHLLQSLDPSVIESMKASWGKILVKWLRSHVGSKLPVNEFSKILTEIWDNLDPQIIKHGFKKVGIHPLERNAL